MNSFIEEVRLMYCPYCGKELADNVNFCSGCGKKVNKEYNGLDNSLVKCPSCGKDISSLAESCPNCGRPVSIVVRCPSCKSTNVKKISSASKAGSALMWGVFAMGKISKTYECKNCGYRW